MKPVLLRSTGKSGRDGRIGAVASLAQRFVGAALAGKSTYPDLAAGHRVQVLLDAARRSDDLSGQAVFFEGKS